MSMKTIVVMFSLLLGIAAVNAATPRTQIKTSDLPKAITENLTSQHAGWTVAVAFKDDMKGVTSYEVVIKKGMDKMRLFYDKDGKYEKMEAVNTTHKSTTSTKTASVKMTPKPKTNTSTNQTKKN